MRKYNCVDYIAFGQRITKRRTELQLSQKEIADKLDCNASYLSKVEHGKAKPTLDFVILLANVLDVGLNYFFPNTNIGADIGKYEFQNKWDQSSPELIKFLSNILECAKQLETDIINRDNIYK